MSKFDLVAGLVLAVFGLSLMFVIIPMGTEEGAYYGLSPTFFPTLLAGGITLCALGLAVQGWLHQRQGGDGRALPITRWNVLMFLIAGVMLIAGVKAIEYVGLIFAGPALIAAFSVFLGERNPLRIGAAAIVPVAVVYLMATHVLRTPLP
jgi:drug/metabolite transporter (DMT)-like permease